MKNAIPTSWWGSLQSVEKYFFGRLTEVNKATKTNNSDLSAYIGTVRSES